MATSVVFPRVQFFANNGRPLIGGRIHTYVAGSSTRARTYKDAAKAQPNPNPIILDARGEAAIYLAEGVEYKFVIEDSKGALIMTQEPVYGAIWPNAAEWPSDATLSYQYMTEAKAAAGAIGPLKFYDTYAQALVDIANIPQDGLVEVARDETYDGQRTRYKKVDGALRFVVSLDQPRPSLDINLGDRFKVIKEYPSRPPQEIYEKILGDYGYSYLYPQSFQTDEVAKELWIALGASGGSNFWTWWWVLDINSGETKTIFSTPSERNIENFSVYKSDGRRYLITVQAGRVAKYDVTLLPSIYSVPAFSAITDDIGARNQLFSTIGGVIYVEMIVRGNQSYKNSYYILDFALNIIGTFTIPVFLSGKPLGYGVSGELAKKQATCGTPGGGLAHSYGGLYTGTNYIPRYHDLGVIVTGSGGGGGIESRFSAPDMLGFFIARNPKNSRVEVEGLIFSSNGCPRCLVMTNPDDEVYSKGMHVVEFFSNDPKANTVGRASPLVAVHMSDWVPVRGGRSLDLPLLNPLTGARFTNITQICEYMFQTGLTTVSFYSTNFPGIWNPLTSENLPASFWVTFTNWNAISVDVTLRSTDSDLRYMYSATTGLWTQNKSTTRAESIPTDSKRYVAGDIAYARDPLLSGCVGWVCIGKLPDGVSLFKPFGALSN